LSLLGRLEDLSLTDIVQIVFLSRRTGMLEIVDGTGRHTVLFRSGLIVNASSPGSPDLVAYLHQRGSIGADAVSTIRQMEQGGIPAGTAAVELNLISRDDLVAAIKDRVLSVVSPLLQSREGEFNFLLRETMSALDIEYDPEALLKEGGFAPQKIVGGGDGEKLKPLRGLEESLKAGKALLRSTPEEPRAPLDLELGKAEEPEPFPEPAELPPPEPAAPPKPSTSQFKVAGGLFEVESPEAAFRNVVLFERNPLIRVAAKRAFTKNNVRLQQFGSLDETRSAVIQHFNASAFFISFLELTDDGATLRLLQQIKRRNPKLPVVVVDSENDLRRRHEAVRAGGDLYLTKPTGERLEPGVAEEELSLFSDELVLFADRAFAQWQAMTGGGLDAGKRFYEEAERETLDRSFDLLKQLINEVSNPNDIDQVASMILRLAAEYLDRGALFAVTDVGFRGLGGFGITGDGFGMPERMARLLVPRNSPSVLEDVVAAGQSHRGKMRKTSSNIHLIEGLGGLLPTEVVALPIAHDGRTVGILYGDNAEHRAPIEGLTGLEIFLSQAGYAFGKAISAGKTPGGREGL
jgi:CheY-like chemotaxis protein